MRRLKTPPLEKDRSFLRFVAGQSKMAGKLRLPGGFQRAAVCAVRLAGAGGGGADGGGDCLAGGGAESGGDVEDGVKM